jgi:hypothetical protein
MDEISLWAMYEVIFREFREFVDLLAQVITQIFCAPLLFVKA